METYRSGFTLHSESDDEVQAATAELNSATITVAQLPVMLQHLYKCPKGVDNVPASAQTLVNHAFRQQGSVDDAQSIDLSTFLAQMEEICHRSESMQLATALNAYLKDGLSTREFVSNLDFRAKLAKHERMKKNPQEKALITSTDAMTLGWSPATIPTTRKSTKSCKETRYVSAMIKAGVYY